MRPHLPFSRLPFTGRARAAELIPQARLGGPVPWVIAIMIALTTIAAAAGLALGNLAANARAEIAGGLTVQVLEALPAERSRQTQAVLSLLDGQAGVAAVRQVPEAELQALIEPWLGEAQVLGDALPIPALVDVRLNGAVTPERIAQLRQLLQDAAPAARIDAQASWLGPVFSAIASLRWMAIGLIALLALTSAAAVWLAVRSALGSNRETIEIVHLLGGTDSQIARIVQRSIALDAALGGAAGLILGVLAVLLLGQQFAAVGSGLIAGGGLDAADWAVIGAIPLIGVALATITARLAVLAELRRML